MKKLTQEIVEEWVREASGLFTKRDIWEDLDIGPGPNRDYLRTVLKRLRDAKLIAYVDGRHGAYRLLDVELERMSLARANPKNVLPIKWPFELERYVKIFRKNIAVLFGSKDAGKTAFLLNLMRLNMDKFPIRYLNTDMGEEELRVRVEKFEDVTIEQWDKYIEMYEKAIVLPEHMNPDAINIVDFLEIHDEFYKIGKPIKEWSAPLNNGILVVAVQKNLDAEFPIGKARSLEKAKLAINLDPNKATLAVAKNWQDGIISSPKGKAWTYKLIGGAKFVNIQESFDDT